MNFYSNSSAFAPTHYGQRATPSGAVMAFAGRCAPQDRPRLFRQLRLVPALEPVVRPLRAGDADAFQAFVQGLSAASRRMRFHGAISACSPALLQYLTQTDNPRHQAWLAIDGAGRDATVVGEARFVIAGDGPDAEFAIAVADDSRGRGVADRLLQTLVQAATRSGIGMLYGDVLEDNSRMFRFMRRHHFEMAGHADVDPGAVRWQRRLASATPSSRPLMAAAGLEHV